MKLLLGPRPSLTDSLWLEVIVEQSEIQLLNVQQEPGVVLEYGADISLSELATDPIHVSPGGTLSDDEIFRPTPAGPASASRAGHAGDGAARLGGGARISRLAPQTEVQTSLSRGWSAL